MKPAQIFAASLIVLALWLCPPGRAQNIEHTQLPAAGSISGRVMNGDQPVLGASILITGPESLAASEQGKPPSRLITDANGRYQSSGLVAGSYQVSVLAPTFVSADFQRVTVGEGQSIEKIDFQMVKGGVITGAVTNSAGRPLIAYSVSIKYVYDAASPTTRPVQRVRLSTDDRGIYRAWGLVPGKYKVFVMQGISAADIMGGRQAPPPIFYPASTSETEAGVVEVGSGTEVAGIDIRIPPPPRGYRVTGRVVDDAGASVANAIVVIADTESEKGLPLATYSNADGIFKLKGLCPPTIKLPLSHLARATITLT